MALVYLNDKSVTEFERRSSLRTWKGHRLFLAIDGTKPRLPGEPEIVEHFGVQEGGKGKGCPMGRHSQLFDPLNSIKVACEFSGMEMSET